MGLQGVGCNQKNPTEIFLKNVGSQYKCFKCSGVCRNWPISAMGQIFWTVHQILAQRLTNG